jgi:hypothetical protein
MSKLRFNHAGFTLVQHLFRQFLSDNELDTEQAQHVTIRQFYHWAQLRKMGDEFFYDKEELQQLYGLEEEHFELVEKMLSDPFDAAVHLFSWWPLIVMAGRYKPKNKVAAISLAGSIRFEDNTTAHFLMPLGLQSEPFTEGMISALWRGQLMMLDRVLKEKSLDELHDEIAASGAPYVNFPVETDGTFVSDIGLEESREDD